MSIMSDKWISEMAELNRMIEPFERGLITNDVISFGLSSYGYDLRLSNNVIRYGEIAKIDPKEMSKIPLLETREEKIEVNGLENILGMSHEYFRIPRGVMGLCIGKSSYARMGILINITPLEPEWEGFITISIINCTKRAVVLYPGEGIAQVVFLKGDEECTVSYKDRKGKYQAQKKIEITKV
ncbi:MAG: dCTP deaminase [Candidatus Fischerbacteria bacterium RBG_13_37_8]|uniref:dCTP deaminase n=1 Tax=Candidatus Fischerbacteria bacterium RBG_13_37_8 TaxID=1817863 RepID=A0A1F5VDC9_9BACT|nr:MAG: dCTP deaminase [Candidatus Fischerbacteria bacterium RBG_13_37_8]